MGTRQISEHRPLYQRTHSIKERIIVVFCHQKSPSSEPQENVSQQMVSGPPLSELPGMLVKNTFFLRLPPPPPHRYTHIHAHLPTYYFLINLSFKDTMQ